MTLSVTEVVDDHTIIIFTDNEVEAEKFVQLVKNFTVFEADCQTSHDEYSIIIWDGPKEELKELVTLWNEIRRFT